jgi:hypothetical protein
MKAMIGQFTNVLKSKHDPNTTPKRSDNGPPMLHVSVSAFDGSLSRGGLGVRTAARWHTSVNPARAAAAAVLQYGQPGQDKSLLLLRCGEMTG